MIKRDLTVFNKLKAKAIDKNYCMEDDKITMSLFDTVNEHVQKDFNMTVKLSEYNIANAYNYKKKVLKLYKDNSYVLSILTMGVSKPCIVIVREDACVKYDEDLIDWENKVFNTFKLKGANIVDEFNDAYLSEVFTAIIEALNYITVIEPVVEKEHEELIAKGIIKNTNSFNTFI